ncbi:DUF4236 domain-containing protein [Saccharopolyspora terrae]|uniref:DUF4236 domain-containing protein n=1 Tax=Saccharopolyspora terrae TaxID=2530384 RepID=A0A4R4VGG2_9PSEU|nr:DUF4236 domain-containing protein [Saccharopolyspora terrae]TDD04482.1 DUF4236 domain-containing protein [Saccharopolyspora terrae]
MRLGPIYLNVHNTRITSWGFKLGRFSRNMTHGKTTIDTPGPGRYTFDGKRRRR